MKKIIIVNLILIIILVLIPNVKIIENINFTTISQLITIEKEKEQVTETKITFISENSIELLKQKEGFDCVATKKIGEKYFTIGHGHYGKDVKEGQTITKEQANELLHNDLKEYSNYVVKHCSYLELTQNEFDALTIFVYNLGENNLIKLTGNHTRTKQEITEHWLAYTNSQSELNRKGLENRRQAELNLFLKK